MVHCHLCFDISAQISSFVIYKWIVAEQFGDDDDVFHSSTEDNREDHTEMREIQTKEQMSADNYAVNSNIKYVSVSQFNY